MYLYLGIYVNIQQTECMFFRINISIYFIDFYKNKSMYIYHLIEGLDKKVSFSAISRILNVHRLTVSTFVKNNLSS